MWAPLYFPFFEYPDNELKIWQNLQKNHLIINFKMMLRDPMGQFAT